MFNALWKHPVSKYLGVLGLFMPFIVLVYYCYIESQTLAWMFFSAIGDDAGARDRRGCGPSSRPTRI